MRQLQPGKRTQTGTVGTPESALGCRAANAGLRVVAGNCKRHTKRGTRFWTRKFETSKPSLQRELHNVWSHMQKKLRFALANTGRAPEAALAEAPMQVRRWNRFLFKCCPFGYSADSEKHQKKLVSSASVAFYRNSSLAYKSNPNTVHSTGSFSEEPPP